MACWLAFKASACVGNSFAILLARLCCQAGASGFAAALTCGSGGLVASKRIVIPRNCYGGTLGGLLKIPGLRGARLHGGEAFFGVGVGGSVCDVIGTGFVSILRACLRNSAIVCA